MCVIVFPPALSPWNYRLWPCHTVLQRPTGYPFGPLSLGMLCPSLPHRAVSQKIKTALQNLQEQNCSDVVLLFSARSLPMSVVKRDPLALSIPKDLGAPKGADNHAMEGIKAYTDSSTYNGGVGAAAVLIRHGRPERV